MQCGDLLQLQAAVGPQDEDLPVGIGQIEDGLTQSAALLPLQEIRFRGGGWVGQVQILVGRVGVTAAALTFAEPGVFSDAAQPGVQAAAAFKPVDVEEGLVEGLLEQLLRLLFVAGQGEEEPVDRLALGMIQFFKAPHGHSSFPMMP